MVQVDDVYRAIHALAPFHTAESWDNVGLLIGSGDKPVAKVLVALDATHPVVEEAKELGADLIVTHHPVIFKPVSRISADSVVYRLIREDIAVISAHTNWDMATGGINDALAEQLGLSDVRPLRAVGEEYSDKLVVFVPKDAAEQVYRAMAEAGAGRLGDYSHCGFFTHGEGRFLPLDGANPAIGETSRLESVEEVRLEMLVDPENRQGVINAMKAAHPYEEPAWDLFQNRAVSHPYSLGRVGNLHTEMTPEDFAGYVRERLGANGLKFVPGKDRIKTVALCGGSGGELLRDAVSAGAQAYVTADTKHNQLLEAGDYGITLVDGGHFATENHGMPKLREQLMKAIPGADIVLSARCADGARYLAGE